MRSTTQAAHSAPSLGRVIGTLQERGLLSGAAATAVRREGGVSDTPDTPAMVQAFMGLGAWLFAAFFLLFLVAVDALVLQQAALPAYGLVLIAMGIWGGRRRRSIFLTQLTLAASLAGKTLVVIGLLGGPRFTSSSLEQFTFVSAVVAAVTYPFCRMPVDRALSTLAPLMFALLWLLESADWSGAGLHLLVACEVCLVTLGLTVSSRRQALRPLAHAGAAGLAVTTLVQLGMEYLRAEFSFFGIVQGVSPALLPSTIILLAVLLWVYARAAGGVRHLVRRPLAFAAFGTIGLGLIAPPCLLVALLLIVLGYARFERAVLGLGFLLLPVALAAYYFHLGVPLVWKSAALAGSGAVLLAASAFLRLQPAALCAGVDAGPSAGAQGLSLGRAFRRLCTPGRWIGSPAAPAPLVLPATPEAEVEAPVRLRGPHGPLRWAYAGVTLGVLAVLNALVWQQEAVQAQGETLYVELAPVDPRSLMQGDYMILRYRLGSWLPGEGPATGGTLVVRPDAQGVAQFVRVHQGTALGAGERLLRYGVRDGRVEFGSGAYCFQEGQAATYAGARYAELRVDAAGRASIVGLRDRHFIPLGPWPHPGDHSGDSRAL